MKSCVLLLTFLCLWYNVSARCLSRGTCATVDGRSKPCAVDEDAKPILKNLTPKEREEVLEMLEENCPHLLFDENGNHLPDNQILTCCDPKQVYGISESLRLGEGVLSRCPVCWTNFKRQICEMNCSPDQARFINVTVKTTADDIRYVDVIDYRVHRDFFLNAHKSCSGVVVPQTGMPAINLMCGNAPVCDAAAWFGYTGDVLNNPFVDVQVNFIPVDTFEDSMHVLAPLCNETTEGEIPCSCLDCAALCPSSEIEIPPICTVLSVNCIGFSVGVTFFALSVTLFMILALLEFRRKRNATVQTSSLESKDNTNALTKGFQRGFEKVGELSAGNPILMIMLTTWVAFALAFGFSGLTLTANPLELWSDPDSVTRQERNYFNSRFGPFYRAAQVFLTMKGLEPFELNNVTYGPAYRIEAINELLKLEDAILNIGRDDGSVKLEDVCYAPLQVTGDPPALDKCAKMSISAYLPERKVNNNTYLGNIQNCINNYLALSCLQTWGGGSNPDLSVGGFKGDNYLEADTLIINFPITNHLEEANLVPVLEWELNFISLMQDYESNWKSDFVEVAYGAERSIEDEVQRISEAEILPIAISYVLMIIYVICALGNIRRCALFFIDSKITVAVASILTVLVALFCAMGFLGYLRVTLSLLAINVIPFFVLSVGIDNVFLMVNSLQRIESNLDTDINYKGEMSFEKKRRYVFGKMMKTEGPSMFVSSVTQVTCFAVGSIAEFPAVRSFAIFASLALAFLFLFQITTVVAVLSLDYKRSSQNRFDIFCCVQKKILNDEEPLQSNKANEGVTQKLMEPYAKFLLNWRVKIIVAILFLTFTSVCVILIPQIGVGLEQNLAVPPDSYVYKYLNAVNQILRIGPPVFFVLKSGLNFTNIDHQNVICGSRLCNDDSLAMQIFLAAQQKEITYLETISNSWLDDFFDWASLPGTCCKYNTTDGGFCSSVSDSPECEYCALPRSEFANGLRPGSEAFDYYFPFFLRDSPTETCNKGGLASYYANVNYVLDSEGRATVHDTNFMAFHSTLSSSYDYIQAVKYAYEVSANITATIRRRTGLDVEVFPYSVFYVFYSQYLTAWGDTFKSLGFCLIGAFLINILATGFNFTITIAMMFTIILVVVDMMGIMYIWNIELNAVSCINLIVSIGIAVEFCSHMAYSYAISNRPPAERVADAIKRVGATIITGITFTNIPIIVLAFSYTEIIEVFFFRMSLSMVILGCLHGMVFFPVLLSYLNDFKYKV